MPRQKSGRRRWRDDRLEPGDARLKAMIELLAAPVAAIEPADEAWIRAVFRAGRAPDEPEADAISPPGNVS